MKSHTTNQGQTTFFAVPLALAVLAVLMSGCITVGPDYGRPAMDLPQKSSSKLVEALTWYWGRFTGMPGCGGGIVTLLTRVRDAEALPVTSG